MNLFYKPKHSKPKVQIPFYLIHVVMNFIVDETIWYLGWWGSLVYLFICKLYQFGDWLLEKLTDFIDWHDDFWDHFEERHRTPLAQK